MIHSIFIGCITVGWAVFGFIPPTAMHGDTGLELKSRGLAPTFENVCMLADEAFAKEDELLFQKLFSNFVIGYEEHRFPDKILALYRDHADTKFKRNILPYVAFGLTGVDRIAQSKFGCEFYSFSIDIMFDPAPQDNRDWGIGCIEHLARSGALLSFPYFVKELLVAPSSEILGTSRLFYYLDECFSKVTPEMAYHIHQRYKKEYSFQKHKRAYEEKAKLLLDAPTLPESASRANVLKQLDEMIAEEGRKFLEKYKDVEPKPYIPPPLPPPGTPERIIE